MRRCPISSVLTAALLLPALSGCAAGLIALEVVPGVIGVGAMAGAEQRAPLSPSIPAPSPTTDDVLAQFDARLLRAQCGDADAQFWIAQRLHNGYNVSPDRAAILAWYLIAAARGQPQAIQRADTLSAQWPAEVVTRARERAARWQPRASGCDAADTSDDAPQDDSGSVT